MKNATLIKDYPTIAIWAREPKNVALYQGLGHEVMAVEIKYGELMYCESYGSFSPFDLYSYCASKNLCPVKEVARANKFGHDIYTMMNHGVCISNVPEAKKHAVVIDLNATYYYAVVIDLNATYYYCGKLFKIVKLPNSNYGLAEIEQPIELK